MFAMQPKYLPKYSVEDYLQWEGNWELIAGVPYSMAPMPSWVHQKINGKIFAAIQEALKGCGNCEANLPVNWKIAEDTVVQPDIVVVCKPFEEGLFLTKTPEIVFEILSPSTAEKDRTLKYELYQEAGVKYYVIVYPLEKHADIFLLDNGAGNQYHLDRKFISGPYRFEIAGCAFELDLGGIW